VNENGRKCNGKMIAEKLEIIGEVYKKERCNTKISQLTEFCC
jgi:hypothetical protein